MNPKYRFFLQLNGGGEKIAANPVFKDDMTLDYELESNQRFYRAKLSGKFSFVRQDFATIMGAAFDTVYYFYIEKSDDWGQTWTQYYKSIFMRTDCTINTDDQIVSVQPNPIDQYNDVLAGLEKEYNLISLAPSIERITLQKRPLIQIYIPGESIVSCFLSGLSWEQDANAIDSISDLESIYHFAAITNIASITLSSGTPSNTTEQQYLAANPWINEAVGTYVGELSGNYKFNADNGYYIQADNPGQNGRYSLYSPQGAKLASTASLNGTDPTAFGMNFDFEYDYPDPNVTDETVYLHYSFLFQSVGRNIPVMGRYLLDVETIADLTTYPLPTDDIVGNNRNYRRVIGYAVSGTIVLSTNFSDNPTEYGLADNGKYYRPPYSIYGQKFYPIARTQWGNYSIWFAFHIFDEYLEEKGRKAYTLRDSYPVSSVLSVLLQQFAPGITHEATPEYSQFLYNANNPITGYSFRLFVTPKSNILVGDYQTPVQKALTTLQQFLDMLRNTFQLYWHIEDNKLRIEHISWYRNGGTYTGNPVVGYDLTALENVRNGKKWAFGTSEYTFDKEDMPERYQFKWADDVTEPFEGQPIQVVSKYVQPGKIEEINIGGFSSDIDLMLLNPEQFSQDGFALLGVVYDELTTDVKGQIYPLPGSIADATNKWVSVGGYFGGLLELGNITTIRIKAQVQRNASYAFLKSNNYLIGVTPDYATGYNAPVRVLANTVVTVDVPADAQYLYVYLESPGVDYRPQELLSVNYVYQLPFVRRDVDNVTYYLQNGLIAMVNLQPQYWLYNMPARNLIVNGVQVWAYGIQRRKSQTLTFPVGDDDPDLLQLVKTYIGNGQYEKLSINLSSRTAEATLKYDTE